MSERNQGAERHVRDRDTLERWQSPERHIPDGEHSFDGAAKEA